MKDTFTIINYVKERIEKTTSIPVYYILFLFMLFLIWQPEYIDFINATKWVPMPIQHILLGFANLVYAHIAIIMTTLIILYTVLYLAFLKTNFFYDLFFSNIKHDDMTIATWNPYTAIRRITNLIINFATIYWIFYFTINVIFNKENFIDHFFDIQSLNENHLVIIKQVSPFNLFISYLLFWANVTITAFFIIRSLFYLPGSDNSFYINNSDIGDKTIHKYIKINTFTNKHNNVKFILLKSTYTKAATYYIVKQESARINNRDNLPVINYSKSLDEILYHFEYLTKS